MTLQGGWREVPSDSTRHHRLDSPHSTLQLYTPPSTLSLYAQHATLHTLHPTLHPPHSTLHNLHTFTPYTRHSTLHPPHYTFTPSHLHTFTPYTRHSTLHLHTSHLTPDTPPSTLHTSHLTPDTPPSTLHTPPFRLHTPRSTLYTSHSPLHTPNSKLYTAQCTLYTRHSTHCTPPLRTPQSKSTMVRYQRKTLQACCNNFFRNLRVFAFGFAGWIRFLTCKDFSQAIRWSCLHRFALLQLQLLVARAVQNSEWVNWCELNEFVLKLANAL